MALFGKKKDTKKDITKEEVEKKQAPAQKALSTDYNLDSIIISPRITEKSVAQGEKNVYTFNVKRSATKYQVRDAIISLYNVTPVKVNIVNKKPAKRLIGSRNRMKHVKGEKKAYVYLKKGDTINLI